MLGKALGEPRLEYQSTLACDRAVVGGWDRPAGEPIIGYTISETMDAGWCWQIEHPDRIHRGYVYSSAFISDESAEGELRSKNPRIESTRLVKFTSGRFSRSWVKNVVAIGNASGFVEPLEATSLAIIVSRCQLLVELLSDCDDAIAPSRAGIFNKNTATVWDTVRDFLSLHYRFNTRLDTPFWQDRRANTDLADAQPLYEYYQQVGPSPLVVAGFVDRSAVFDANSYLTILTGLKVPYQNRYTPTVSEEAMWARWCQSNSRTAQSAATVEQSLAIITGGTQI
jgi:tryptophan halogenase